MEPPLISLQPSASDDEKNCDEPKNRRDPYRQRPAPRVHRFTDAALPHSPDERDHHECADEKKREQRKHRGWVDHCCNHIIPPLLLRFAREEGLHLLENFRRLHVSVVQDQKRKIVGQDFVRVNEVLCVAADLIEKA